MFIGRLSRLARQNRDVRRLAGLGEVLHCQKGAISAESQSRALSTAAGVAERTSNLPLYGTSAVIAALAGIVAYDFYSIQPAESRIHLTKLPAAAHPHDIGEFRLTDHAGKPFTEKNVKGEFAVLLFGSLDHPDVHVWLDRFAQCLWKSDDKCNQEHLKPIFLSLDAKLDTPERCKALKDSLKSHRIHKELFHRRVSVVTGEDTSKVHDAAHHFTRKFFGKDPKNTGTPRSTDLGDIYMISPDGKFLESYTLEADPDRISDDWARVQNAWNIHHPSWHGCRNVAHRYA